MMMTKFEISLLPLAQYFVLRRGNVVHGGAKFIWVHIGQLLQLTTLISRPVIIYSIFFTIYLDHWCNCNICILNHYQLGFILYSLKVFDDFQESIFLEGTRLAEYLSVLHLVSSGYYSMEFPLQLSEFNESLDGLLPQIVVGQLSSMPQRCTRVGGGDLLLPLRDLTAFGGDLAISIASCQLGVVNQYLYIMVSYKY